MEAPVNFGKSGLARATVHVFPSSEFTIDESVQLSESGLPYDQSFPLKTTAPLERCALPVAATSAVQVTPLLLERTGGRVPPIAHVSPPISHSFPLNSRKDAPMR